MRHTHYIVVAYDEAIECMGGVEILRGQITFDLIVDNEEAAISKAQKLVFGRNWYKVTSVFEHNPDLEIATQHSEPILQQLKDGELTLDRIQIMEDTGAIKILPDLVAARSVNGTS